MPAIHLIGRQFDIKTAVLTETIAEMVRILPCLYIFLSCQLTSTNAGSPIYSQKIQNCTKMESFVQFGSAWCESGHTLFLYEEL